MRGLDEMVGVGAGIDRHHRGMLKPAPHIVEREAAADLAGTDEPIEAARTLRFSLEGERLRRGIDGEFADGVDDAAFNALSNEERTRLVLAGLNAGLRFRRILSPAESVNALTVGALHDDGHRVIFALICRRLRHKTSRGSDDGRRPSRAARRTARHRRLPASRRHVRSSHSCTSCIWRRRFPDSMGFSRAT